MRYFVIGEDGLKYGPAEVPTLNGWIAEGRLLATTTLENELTGEQLAAQAVPGLAFQSVGAPALDPLGYPIGGPAIPRPEVNTPTPNPTPFAAYPRGYATLQTVPKGFNWGAFYFSWVWGLNHRKPILLLIIPASIVVGLIPGGGLATLGFQIWLGFQGNQWAWDSGRWNTIDEMVACQKIWATWAIAFFAFSIVAAIVLMIMFFAMFSQSTSVVPR